MEPVTIGHGVVIAVVTLICLSVWTVHCAAANKVETTAGGQIAQEIMSQWRVLFPEQPYVCWQKESPWKGLDKLQVPPEGIEGLHTIRLDMGRNEYESASFVLTNLSDGPMEFGIACAPSDPVGLSITLRKAVWVTVDGGSQVNDALSLIDDGRVDIPPGESLEIWVTLHGNGTAAGRYRQTIEIVPQGLAPRVVNMDVTVHDVSLPKTLPLAVFYFDELEGALMAPGVVEAYMADLKSHYVNHAFVHPDHLPRLAVDSKGKLATDYARFDEMMDTYKVLDPQRYIFFWASESFLEPTGDWSPDHPESRGRPEFMTPEWKALFRPWLRGWVAHMKARGLGYDAFVMHPYDERGGPEVQAMVQLIKEVDPNILVLFNGALGRTVEELERNIAPYVDVWVPYLYHYLDDGGVHGGISQVVPLEPTTDYTLSFWGKNGGASIYWDMVFDGATPRKADGLDAAGRWREETFSFTTASDVTQVEVRFFPTIGNKTIFIDDVVLRTAAGPNLVVGGDMAGDLSTHWRTMSATVAAHTADSHSGRQCAEVRNIPRPPGPEKAVAKRLLGREKDFFWTYANPIGTGPTKSSPYSAYRVPVWRAWKEGMNGFSTWTYKGGRWNTEEGPNWGLVYRADAQDCPAEASKQELVIPSKRWEASREGVEDYAYLYLLKQAIGAGSQGADAKAAEKAKALMAFWIEEVLKKPDSPLLADKAKKQIMEQLVRMSPAQ